MYNAWLSWYPKRSDKSLLFKADDLSDMSTFDLIISFCKKNYPSDWKEKSAILMDMTNEGFESVYLDREKFYNK